MIQTKVKVTFDTKKTVKGIEDKTKKAQKKLDAKVLADSNFFCPLVSSELQKSGVANTVLGSGKVIWNASYAKKQYYGIKFDHSKSDNPNATAKWFESAKAKHLNSWRSLVKDEIKHS